MTLATSPPTLIKANGNGINGDDAHPTISSSTAEQWSFEEISEIYTNTGQWVPPPPTPPPPSITPPTPISQRRLFKAHLRSFPRRSEHDSFIWIEFVDLELLGVVKEVLPLLSELYEKQPGVDARELHIRREDLLAVSTRSSQIVQEKTATLLEYLTDKFAYVHTTLATYPPGAISWHLLWILFRAGEELQCPHEVSGEMMAVVLDSWAYVQETMGRMFVLTSYYYQWAGTAFHKVKLIRKIPEFSELRKIEALSVRPLSAKRRHLLAERGKTYLEYSKSHHAAYNGFFYTRAFAGATKLLGTGQVLTDVTSFRRCNPSLDNWSDDVNDQGGYTAYQPPSRTGSQRVEEFDAEVLCHLLPPTLHGFSLRAKRWGEFLISRLSPITWRTEAFAHLVIPDSYRRIIKSLVTVHAGELKGQLLTDVVDGKGEGLILALHGKPGTGKTLTAEAIAQHLRRPLYMVSAGELGTTAVALERQLKEVLELATLWNAVLLIDEADIFLEKRSNQQLERNALVAIFLRLLEYFSGVLILTTNSIEKFDPAFMSRFSLVLEFGDLDFAGRRTLWERFIKKAGYNPARFDLDQLASHALSGRSLKSTVQTAQALSLAENEYLSMAHFEEVLSVAKAGLALS
ncbi:P-loop containing nucleoside triphosphate hydrolase protein [Meredithblackwellia eburnea MCA 4105]